MYFFSKPDGTITSREFQYTVEVLNGEITLLDDELPAQVILAKPAIEGWTFQQYWRGTVEECFKKAEMLGLYTGIRRPSFIPALLDFSGEGLWLEPREEEPPAVERPARPKPAQAKAYKMKLVNDEEKPIKINWILKS